MSVNNKLIVLFLLPFAFSVQAAEKYRAGFPTNDNKVIIAKGDIPTPEKFQPIIAAFMAQMTQQMQMLENEVTLMLSHIEKNELELARQDYIRAHSLYESMRPIMVLFGHADRVINPHASYFIDKEQDPRFIGFHRVEFVLFSQHSFNPNNVDNVKSVVDAKSAAQDLLHNIHDLAQRVAIETIPIAKLAQSADDYLELILADKLAGKENLYSHSDLTDIAANIAGSRYVVETLKPFIQPTHYADLITQFTVIENILKHYQTEDKSYLLYPDLTAKDKQRLFSLITRLAEQTALLRGQLSIDVYYKYQNQLAGSKYETQ